MKHPSVGHYIAHPHIPLMHTPMLFLPFWYLQSYLPSPANLPAFCCRCPVRCVGASHRQQAPNVVITASAVENPGVARSSWRCVNSS